MGGLRRRLTAERVAAGSLAVDACMVTAKLAAGLATGSLGLLSEAAHSALDLAASIFALLAVRAARKPADREHPYGHGRAENLAAFGEGAILLATASVIAYEALRRLGTGHVGVDAAWYAIALAAAAIVVESVRAPLLQWAGRRFASPALRAGAQNRLADIFSATGVLLGLIGVRLGLYWADAVAALLVAAIIFRSAALLAWRSGDILIDRAPSGVEDAVRDTIAGVHGVRDVRSVRVRRSGDRMIGDAVVTARPTLTVEGAQQLREEVAGAVREGHPRLDLALVVESQSDAEHLVERVHAVTDRQPLVRDVHNVTVEREQDGSLHLSLHVKLPGEMTLEAAGRTSALIETSLRNEFPELHRVDVHLEPLEPDSVAGADVTQRRADLAGRIRRSVEEHPAVLRCTDVELSARGPELVAHVVASLRGELTLKQAHEVETELEEQLRRALPEVSEVVARVTP